MFKRIKEDIVAAKKNDPAAPSKFIIFLTYPGVKALRRHRRANFFYRHKLHFIAYFIAARTRKKTGIEIHPAAKIGRRVFIDHGMGTVIGATAIIGDDCIIFHGVTLGSNTFENVDRHPKIGSNVIIYPNSTLVGPIKIGANSIVGANSLVLKDFGKNLVIGGAPAKILKENHTSR